MSARGNETWNPLIAFTLVPGCGGLPASAWPAWPCTATAAGLAALGDDRAQRLRSRLAPDAAAALP